MNNIYSQMFLKVDVPNVYRKSLKMKFRVK